MNRSQHLCYDSRTRIRDASRGCLKFSQSSRKAYWQSISSVLHTRLRTHFVDMSPPTSKVTRIGRIIDASLLFSSHAYPVGAAVMHHAHGDGVVVEVRVFERSVTFQNLQQVEITDVDRLLAQLDGDEVDHVMELSITHQVLPVSQLRKKQSNSLIFQKLNLDTKRVIEFSELKTRHDNKHYHDSI